MPVLYAADNLAKLVSNAYSQNKASFALRSLKYQRYVASVAGVPIFSRSMPDTEKVNNQINNDFVGDVIDTKLGYMISTPVTYMYEDYLKQAAMRELPIAERINIESVEQELVDSFVIENNIEDLDLETVKFASVCGTAFRLCYINEDGMPAVMNIYPWDAVVVYDASGKEASFAVRFYVMASIEDSTTVKYTIYAEYYDEEYVYFFKENSSRSDLEPIGTIDFVVDTTIYAEGRLQHGFGFVPLIEFVNNDAQQGDCDKTIALIDVYDRCLSDQTSEVEQFRLAYLALYGLDAAPEDIAKMKQTGAFKMTVDGKVEFITKDMNATVLENMLKQIAENIIRFSKSVDFTDKNFAGNLSGIAIKYKLIKLEHKCSISEIKMKKATRAMWKVIASAYSRLFTYFDYRNISMSFTRNIPINLLEEARIQRELRGLVSTETRLRLASFITNPKQEIKKMQDELESGLAGQLSKFYESVVDEDDDALATNIENEDYNEERNKRRKLKELEDNDNN